MRFTVTAIHVKLGTITSQEYTLEGTELEFPYAGQSITAPEGFAFQPRYKIRRSDGVEPTWITFAEVEVDVEGEKVKTFVLKVYTDVLEDAARHRMSLVLTSGYPLFVDPSPQAYQGIVPFNVIIYASDYRPPNAPPIFEPALEASHTIEVGESWSYALPPRIDPEF